MYLKSRQRLTTLRVSWGLCRNSGSWISTFESAISQALKFLMLLVFVFRRNDCYGPSGYWNPQIKAGKCREREKCLHPSASVRENVTCVPGPTVWQILSLVELCKWKTKSTCVTQFRPPKKWMSESELQPVTSWILFVSILDLHCLPWRASPSFVAPYSNSHVL